MIELPVVQAMQGGLSEPLLVEGELGPLFAEILAFVSSNPGPGLDGLDQPTIPLAEQSGGNQSPVDFEQAIPPAPLMFLPTATDTVEELAGPNVEAQFLIPDTMPDLQAEEHSDGELPGIPQAHIEQPTIPTPVAPPVAGSVETPAPEGVLSVAETAIGRPQPGPLFASPVEAVTHAVSSSAAVEPTTLPSNVTVKVTSPPAPGTAQAADAPQPTAPTVAPPTAHEIMAGHNETSKMGKVEGLPTPAVDRVDNVPETAEASASTAPSLTGSPGSERIERPDPPALVQRIDRWLSTRPTTPNTLVLEFGESGNFRVTVALRTAGLQITVAGAGTEDIPWIQELSATLESRGLDAEVSSDAESGQRNDADSQDEQPNWNPPPLKRQPTSEQGLRL
jgi:hypothetical protein